MDGGNKHRSGLPKSAPDMHNSSPFEKVGAKKVGEYDKHTKVAARGEPPVGDVSVPKFGLLHQVVTSEDDTTSASFGKGRKGCSAAMLRNKEKLDAISTNRSRKDARRPLLVSQKHSTSDIDDIEDEEMAERVDYNDDDNLHLPTQLPKFKDLSQCHWTSSHAANSPSEDRSCSLVNVLLKPTIEDESTRSTALIRLSLWGVIDGHGGGCVATYASEVLLPHICASVSRALKCDIVDRGTCTVNGQLRDAYALDLDGLIRTSDRSRSNPNSIHYRAPEEEEEDVTGGLSEEDTVAPPLNQSDSDDNQSVAEEEPQDMEVTSTDDTVMIGNEASSVASPKVPKAIVPEISSAGGAEVLSVGGSVKTSVRTAGSHPADGPTGTHSPTEVAKVTKAITDSFLAVDEGWINSIDPVSSAQTSCQTNGRWNAGACALVVFTIQRWEWTATAAINRVPGLVGPDMAHQDTSHNKDAARRRMQDYATQGKSACSFSTISSSSSLLTSGHTHGNTSAFESEFTEDDEDEEGNLGGNQTKRKPRNNNREDARLPQPDGMINSPGGCGCHSYRALDAMLYTAHVGDCRAVLLGTAPPRTIKVGVGQEDHSDTTDDESSHHSSDETEILSSSDHDAESSDEDESALFPKPPYLSYMRRPARRQIRRSPLRDAGTHAPFVALPPLNASTDNEEEEEDSRAEGSFRNKKARRQASDDSVISNQSSQSSQESREMSPPLHLDPFTRPIDLTTDHSAYNPTEVTAVLRRSNNAPRAISSGVGGGIKRVAGSLAVTRALGDAYLKTPRLSFNPYKTHAPYITARPEVNWRLLAKDGDKVLILASDGVWERCSGEDVLRWIRNYSAERVAEAERRSNRRRGIKTIETMSQRLVTENSNGDEDSLRAESPSAGVEASTQATQQQSSGGRSNEASNCKATSPVAMNSKKRKMRSRRSIGPVSTIADVIVRRVLNKVRRARNMSSLHALMTLPKGRARRSKHDDITASVVDLSAFVS